VNSPPGWVGVGVRKIRELAIPCLLSPITLSEWAGNSMLFPNLILPLCPCVKFFFLSSLPFRSSLSAIGGLCVLCGENLSLFPINPVAYQNFVVK